MAACVDSRPAPAMIGRPRGTIARVGTDGKREVVAEPGGGPNGAAIGPDGKLYVCNNGKAFDYVDMQGLNFPVQPPTAFEGGRIERIDLDSGEVERLYDECDGRALRAPNDLVFDGEGGFYVCARCHPESFDD